MVRELSKIYAGVDPVHEPIPIRPVVHYMMGGVDTDIDGATDAAGPVRRGRDRLCVPQRRQPAGLELAHRVSRLRRLGAAQHAVGFAKGRATRKREPRLRVQAEEEAGPHRRMLRGRKKGGEKISQIRREMNEAMESGCGVYRKPGFDGSGRCASSDAQLKERVADLAAWKTRARSSTPSSWPRSSSSNMLDVGPRGGRCSPGHRNESRGRPHPRRLRDARRPELSCTTRCATYEPERTSNREEAGDAGSLGARGAEVLMSRGSQEVRGHALRPGSGRGAPDRQATTFRSSPIGRSWTRSTTSRTRSTAPLSHRWSCRMAVCGSCGMMVNGEPEAHLQGSALPIRRHRHEGGAAGELSR